MASTLQTNPGSSSPGRASSGTAWNPRNWSIALRLIVSISMVLIVAVAAMTFTAVRVSRPDLEREIGGILQNEAEATNSLVQVFLAGKVTALAGLANSLVHVVTEQNLSYTGNQAQDLSDIKALDAQWKSETAGDTPGVDAANKELTRFEAQFAGYTNLIATDRYGALVSTTNESSGYYQADQRWWQSAWNGGEGNVHLAAIQDGDTGAVSQLRITVPIRDSSDQPVGVLSTLVDIKPLMNSMSVQSGDRHGYSAILDGSGRAIYAGDGKSLPKPLVQSLKDARSGFRVVTVGTDQKDLLGYHVIGETENDSTALLFGTRVATETVEGLRSLGWVAVARQPESEALKSHLDMEQTLAWSGLIMIILAALVLLLLVRPITRPLVELARVARQIASGDLSGNVPVDEHANEIGILSRSFRTMAENLRELIGKVQEEGTVVASAAGQVATSTSQLASGATEMATAVTETTTTMDELKQTAEVANEKAQSVTDDTNKAMQASVDGREALEDINQVMGRITHEMDAIADGIMRLNDQTKAIADIIATVDDIAERSSLLAVNAAIEAAKADEKGKGFTVVAQEIRSLAEQSKRATAQVRTILNDVEEASSAAIMATEQGRNAVKSGGEQARHASESILTLAETNDAAAQVALQIAASSQQQLAGVDQVATAMEDINQTSSQTAQSARELESAAKSLDEIGHRLAELLKKYHI